MDDKFQAINDKYFDFGIFDEIISRIEKHPFYDATIKLGIQHAITEVKNIRNEHYEAIKNTLEGQD